MKRRLRPSLTRLDDPSTQSPIGALLRSSSCFAQGRISRKDPLVLVSPFPFRHYIVRLEEVVCRWTGRAMLIAYNISLSCSTLYSTTSGGCAPLLRSLGGPTRDGYEERCLSRRTSRRPMCPAVFVTRTWLHLLCLWSLGLIGIIRT